MMTSLIIANGEKKRYHIKHTYTKAFGKKCKKPSHPQSLSVQP